MDNKNKWELLKDFQSLKKENPNAERSELIDSLLQGSGYLIYTENIVAWAFEFDVFRTVIEVGDLPANTQISISQLLIYCLIDEVNRFIEENDAKT